MVDLTSANRLKRDDKSNLGNNRIADCIRGILRIDDARVAKLGSPRHDVGLQVNNCLVARDGGLEILKFLAGLRLNILADLDNAVEEDTDLGEVFFGAIAGSHRGGADTDTAGGERGLVAGDAVTVQGDVRGLADLLDLASGEFVRADVPEEQMVVGAISHELVSELHHGRAKSLGVLDNALGIVQELRSSDLLGLHGETGDLMVVGTCSSSQQNSSKIITFL